MKSAITTLAMIAAASGGLYGAPEYSSANDFMNNMKEPKKADPAKKKARKAQRLARRIERRKRK